MRISSGELKGRKIVIKKPSAKGKVGGVRPTSAKVREALFDILRNDIRGSAFLDLYAGTGAIGIEALSRGASGACFVEADRMRSKAISQHISKMGLDLMTEVFTGPVERFLRRTQAAAEMTFDIIFADPPYASDEIERILPLIAAVDILRPGGCLIIEHSSIKKITASCGDFRLIRNYIYGDTMLTLYRMEQ